MIATLRVFSQLQLSLAALFCPNFFFYSCFFFFYSAICIKLNATLLNCTLSQIVAYREAADCGDHIFKSAEDDNDGEPEIGC